MNDDSRLDLLDMEENSNYIKQKPLEFSGWIDIGGHRFENAKTTLIQNNGMIELYVSFETKYASHIFPLDELKYCTVLLGKGDKILRTINNVQLDSREGLTGELIELKLLRTSRLDDNK